MFDIIVSLTLKNSATPPIPHREKGGVGLKMMDALLLKPNTEICEKMAPFTLEKFMPPPNIKSEDRAEQVEESNLSTFNIPADASITEIQAPEAET